MQLFKLLLLSSWKRRGLILAIFVLLGIMRLMIVFIPFRYYTKYLLIANSSVNWQLTPLKISYALMIGRLVCLVSHLTPWPSKCLVQGLTCRFLLRKLLIPSTFYIGVSKDENNQLISHAWINCAEETILGDKLSFKKYKIISCFEDR